METASWSLSEVKNFKERQQRKYKKMQVCATHFSKNSTHFSNVKTAVQIRTHQITWALIRCPVVTITAWVKPWTNTEKILNPDVQLLLAQEQTNILWESLAGARIPEGLWPCDPVTMWSRHRWEKKDDNIHQIKEQFDDGVEEQPKENKETETSPFIFMWRWNHHKHLVTMTAAVARGWALNSNAKTRRKRSDLVVFKPEFPL